MLDPESMDKLYFWVTRLAGAWIFIIVQTSALLSYWLYPKFGRGSRRRICGVGFLWVFNLLRLLVFTLLLLPAWIKMLRFYCFSQRLLKGIEYGRFRRNTLDIYLPSQNATHIHEAFADPSRRCPVVVFFAGGAWTIGYKAWGALMGRQLIDEGLILVTPDYRNFPQARVPDMVNDVSSAIAWVFENIAAYGGDPEQVFLVGQSAGAHLSILTMLLHAQMESWKECPSGSVANGRASNPQEPRWSTSQLKACVAISGPYDIVNLLPHFHAKGLATSVLRSIFGEEEHDKNELLFEEFLRAWGIKLDGEALPEYRLRSLSPTCLLADNCIRPSAIKLLPPISLLHGTGDRSVPYRSSEHLALALKQVGAVAELVLFPEKTHTEPIIEDPMQGTENGPDPLLSYLIGVVDKESAGLKRSGVVHQRMAPSILIRLASFMNPF